MFLYMDVIAPVQLSVRVLQEQADREAFSLYFVSFFLACTVSH